MLMLDRATILVTEQIGRTQSLTPEGFLFCQDVRIARTGQMKYRADEAPDIEAGGSPSVILDRDATVLFDEVAIRSFAGKPITNDHPGEFVGPDTWKRDAVGVVLEPRRGEGVDAEFLVADFLITDAAAIKDIQSGKREVSCGYDCERETVKPGYGRLTKIVGNHVALVTRGRAGSACAINDEDNMATKPNWMTRLRTAFKAKDEGAFEEELEATKDEFEKEEETKDDDEKKTEDSMSPVLKAVADMKANFDARFDAIEKRISDSEEEEKKEKEAEDEDEKEEAMDRAALQDAYRDTISRAEILSPGVKVPTFDAAAGRGLIHQVQITALQSAYADSKQSKHVIAMLGPRPDFAKLTKDACGMAFRGASELARASNNPPPTTTTFVPAGQMTAQKLQEINAAKRVKAS